MVLTIPALMILGSSLRSQQANLLGMLHRNKRTFRSTATTLITNNTYQARPDGTTNTQATANSTISSNVETVKSEVVQVSGANGSKVLANSQEILKLAEQFQSSNPAVASMLVKLGNLGLNMGQALGEIESGEKRGSGNVGPTHNSFARFWLEVQMSSDYQLLSPADQQLVASFANGAISTTENYMSDASNFIANNGQSNGNQSASQSVKDNSNAIKKCGQDDGC